MLRCQARRARAALAAAPLPGALLLVLFAAAPLASWQGGRSVGAALRPLLRDPELARLLAVAPLVAGATAGAAVCLATAGRRPLGRELAALPVGARAALVATVLAPAALALALGLPAGLALAVSFGASSPGGATAGVALLTGGLAAAAFGAALAESMLHLRGGAWSRGAASLLALGAAWAGAGAVWGSALLGPLAATGTALAGRTGSWGALAWSALAAVLAGVAWLELAARRPEPARGDRGRRRRLVAGPPVTALPLAGAALLARRADVRLGVAAAAGLGLAGVVLADRAGVPSPGPAHLGASSTLIGAALAPLAVGGALRAGRWAWVAAPRARLLPCLSFVVASHAVLLCALAPVLAVAALVSGAPPGACAQVGVVLLAVAAAALLAGSLVPWRGVAMGDQVAAFAAFAACACALSALAALAGPRLVAAGVPTAAAAALVLAAATSVSVAAVARRLLAPRGAA